MHKLVNELQVTKETSLAEALFLLEENQQTAALVLDENTMVRGVLTKDRIISALEEEASCKAGTADPNGDDTCKVDLVLDFQQDK